MSELTIRRNRGGAIPSFQSAGKTEKPSSGAPSQKAAARPGFTVSETLRQLMSRSGQAENHSRESRRILQAGESVLAEVQDSLEHMERLAQEAEEGNSPDRGALQAELERLREGVGRMISGASAGGVPLFLDEAIDPEEGAQALLYAVMSQSAGEVPLPDWLANSLVQDAPSIEQLLAALGLDKNASPSELLAAIAGCSLENDLAAGYLASLYLGSIIAGGTELDPQLALEGLRQLLETVSRGVSLDQAIEQLTHGTFTSLTDFQAQFTGGTAPGLQDFLAGLLLPESPGEALPASPLLTLLVQTEGLESDLLMGLMTVLQQAEISREAAPETAPEPVLEASIPSARDHARLLNLGSVQVLGQDLSQVSFDASTGVLTVGGPADVIIQGTGPEIQEILVTGSGTVTIQNVTLARFTAAAPEVHLSSSGTNTLGQIVLREGSILTLGGIGLLRTADLQADSGAVLRQTGGAVVLGHPGQTPQPLTVPLILDGPISLAAHAARASSPDGTALSPFDLVWETLLPGWSSITSIEAEGRHAKMLLSGNAPSTPVRLWLAKGDQGYPIHSLVIRGRDQSGHPRTRYAYLLWSQYTGAFQEVSMYPNPFTVTGGEAGRDWVYEEESHTLRILTNQVTALSGGAGTDGNQLPFSGRIALTDGIGAAELALGGVVCQVSSGGAFRLGQNNQITLVLRSGSDNRFESGDGFAGISLGDGTALRIDWERPASGQSPGSLIASGSGGGAGIGRDCGAGRNRNSHIVIRGGVITASGSGGGAGIGAGKQAAMGSVTILGGSIASTGGSGGGAGIGGALGAPVGDISIHGGVITAQAVYHAAAIGAGIQGECGSIRITGSARVMKATGGDPGADIGACLFGGCGEVFISSGADIGGAQLRRQSGVPLRMGGDTVTLPQFRLSPSALMLDRLRLSTQEDARSARLALKADRRWVARIQTAYGALYSRLEQSFSGLYCVYPGAERGPVRDAGSAGALLQDMRQSIPSLSSQALDTHSRRAAGDVGQLLR